jgi:hypothetical protein
MLGYHNGIGISILMNISASLDKLKLASKSHDVNPFYSKARFVFACLAFLFVQHGNPFIIGPNRIKNGRPTV